jgi:hypothetical protein
MPGITYERQVELTPHGPVAASQRVFVAWHHGLSRFVGNATRPAPASNSSSREPIRSSM